MNGDQDDHGKQYVMKALWFVFIVLATLGSVYPFNFQIAAVDGNTVSAFLQSCCKMPGRGDLVGNIILFAPIGFTGMFAVATDSPVARRFAYVCAMAAVVALGLQLAQMFLPSRDENLQDVLWNTAGTAAGAVLATLLGRVTLARGTDANRISLIPATLVGTWIAYRLMPFVPSLDFQLIKDSLKPLFSTSIDAGNVVHDFAAWLVVAYLLRIAQRDGRLDRYLPRLVAAVFCFEIVIVNNSISLANAIGASLAIFFWFTTVSRTKQPERALVITLACALILNGLLPFEIRGESLPFAWLPFRGFLGGSMYINAQSAADKVFLYGSFVFLLWRTGLNRFTGVAIALAMITLIELMQKSVIGHFPEITDPILVAFAGFALVALERHENGNTINRSEGSRVDRLTGVDQRDDALHGADSRVTTDVQSMSGLHRGHWRRQTVNFRRSQYEILERLARELNISVSGVTRKIIEEFITRLNEGLDTWSSVRTDDSLTIKSIDLAEEQPRRYSRQKWVRQTVNLRKSQFDFLRQLSLQSNMSVSGLTREIVVLFIESSICNDGEISP